MVPISRQYLSGADKPVQIRRSVFVDKGPQPELRHRKSEIALLIRGSVVQSIVSLTTSLRRQLVKILTFFQQKITTRICDIFF